MRFFVWSAALWLFFGGATPAAQDVERQKTEELEDYFRKWLEEDVGYIITDEERDVFLKLTTVEEQEQFIEQFWFRRDPDIRTPENEFKEEHYRRIAYTNEWFTSGKAGWRTDRGRIYIIHGAPDQRHRKPAGGAYDRKPEEGGGFTATVPFEVWVYNHIEGVGQEVELEFVDKTWSGEYKLTLNKDEKDALLYVPFAGPTNAETLGLSASKVDRPAFSPGNAGRYPLQFLRARDNPFIRYENFVQLQASQQIKYKDLRQLVDVDVAYNSIPFEIREDYFRLNDEQTLVPITVEIDNRHLNFVEADGVHRANVAVYGIVSSLGGQLIAEFEHDLVTSYEPEFIEAGRRQRSAYQKVLVLDTGGRYKLDFLVKDLNTAQVGVTRRAIVPPRLPQDELAASTLVLTSKVEVLDEIPTGDEMFVLGDIKMRPSVRRAFAVGTPLNLYLQLYNVALDQARLEPALRFHLKVLRDQEVVHEAVDTDGQSIQLVSGRRVVLVRRVGAGLAPGRYQLVLEVEDQIDGSSLVLNEDFEVVAGARTADSR